jgi:hypothetical protein
MSGLDQEEAKLVKVGYIETVAEVKTSGTLGAFG